MKVPSASISNQGYSLKGRLLDWVMIGGVFAIAFELIVLRPIGTHFSIIQGVYGDTRFINFILEHIYRWFSGLEPSLWNTPMFYPFPLTLAFSDNLLGMAPLYAGLRWGGLDQESALQGWFLASFILNYAAAAFALSRLKFSAPASAMGALFFTFGLPMLAQENHYQLLYRFCIPLACVFFWEFAAAPRLAKLAVVAFLVTWQLHISVYLGIFLVLLLAALALVMPFFLAEPEGEAARWKALLLYWPGKVKAAWLGSRAAERWLCFLVLAASLASLVIFFRPYAEAQQLYGFTRNWDQVAIMLPRLQSYLVADHLGYWSAISTQLWGMPGMRNEHQLFPGWVLYALVVTGMVWRARSSQRKMALIHLLVVALLVVLSLYVNGFSLWRVLYTLPGLDSIRSVTRVQLALMWPLALFGAYTLDALRSAVRKPLLAALVSLLIIAAFAAEALNYSDDLQFTKNHAQQRVTDLRSQLPATLPAQPILFLAVDPDVSSVTSDMDAALLAQDLNASSLNGYSGNVPPGYQPATSCIEAPRQIIRYMHFAHITEMGFYLNMMQRVVPIGFKDCDPAWWKAMPPE